MRENVDQDNSEYGHFSHSDFDKMIGRCSVILPKKVSHREFILEFVESFFLGPASSILIFFLFFQTKNWQMTD